MQTPSPAKGEAMPAKKLTDDQIALAKSQIQNDIRELMLMADIAVNAWDDIGPAKKINENCFQYQFTTLERDCFDFLISNVAERASVLRVRFEAAVNGGAN